MAASSLRRGDGIRLIGRSRPFPRSTAATRLPDRGRIHNASPRRDSLRTRARAEAGDRNVHFWNLHGHSACFDPRKQRAIGGARASCRAATGRPTALSSGSSRRYRSAIASKLTLDLIIEIHDAKDRFYLFDRSVAVPHTHSGGHPMTTTATASGPEIMTATRRGLAGDAPHRRGRRPRGNRASTGPVSAKRRCGPLSNRTAYTRRPRDARRRAAS